MSVSGKNKEHRTRGAGEMKVELCYMNYACLSKFFEENTSVNIL